MHSSPVREQSSTKFKITSMSRSTSKRRSQHYSPNDNLDLGSRNLNPKNNYSPILGDDGSEEINYSKWCRQHQSGTKPQSAFKFPPLDSDSIFFREEDLTRDATYLTRDHRDQSFLQQSGDDTRDDELYHKDLGFEKSKHLLLHSSNNGLLSFLPTSKAASTKSSSSSSTVSETCPSSSTSTTCLSELGQENGVEMNDKEDDHSTSITTASVVAALTDESNNSPDILNLLHPFEPLPCSSFLAQTKQPDSPFLFSSSSSSSSSSCPDEYCSPLQREPTRKNRKSKMEMAKLFENGNPRTFELKGSINIAQNAKNALTERLKSSPGGMKILERIDYNNNSISNSNGNSNNNSKTPTPQKLNNVFISTSDETSVMSGGTNNDHHHHHHDFNIHNRLNHMHIDINNNNDDDDGDDDMKDKHITHTPIATTATTTATTAIMSPPSHNIHHRPTNDAITTSAVFNTVMNDNGNHSDNGNNHSNNRYGCRFDHNNPPTSPYKRLLSPYSKPSSSSNRCFQLNHSHNNIPVNEAFTNIPKLKVIEIKACNNVYTSSSGKSLLMKEVIDVTAGGASASDNNERNNSCRNDDSISPFRSVLYKDMFHHSAMHINISPVHRKSNSSSSSSSSLALFSDHYQTIKKLETNDDDDDDDEVLVIDEIDSESNQQRLYENRKRKMTMTEHHLSAPLKQSHSRSSSTLSLYMNDNDDDDDSITNGDMGNDHNYHDNSSNNHHHHMSGRQNPVQAYHYYEDDDDDDEKCKNEKALQLHHDNNNNNNYNSRIAEAVNNKSVNPITTSNDSNTLIKPITVTKDDTINTIIVNGNTRSDSPAVSSSLSLVIAVAANTPVPVKKRYLQQQQLHENIATTTTATVSCKLWNAPVLHGKENDSHNHHNIKNSSNTFMVKTIMNDDNTVTQAHSQQ